MSLESNIAALVAASTGLTQAVNITKATVEATRDSAIAKEAPVTTAKDAVLASTTAASTDAATTAAKLTAVAADYAAQKTTKGLAAVQTSADSELKDRLHRRDPARHPFRGARPSLVMDFVRRECHRNNAAGNLEPVDLSTFMTFTRASTATYVGPDGLIKEAASNVPRYGYDPVTGEALGLLIEEQRTNLVTYSMQSAMAGWDKTGVSALANTIISPAGDLTGGTVTVSTAAQSAISKSVTLVVGVVYTTSVYVKAGNTNVVTIRLGRGPTFLAGADITLGTSAEAVHVGNGWYRCTIISTASDGTNGAVLVYPGGRITQSVGNYVYIWGAQCEAGSFPTSYIPTPATFTGRASTKTYFDSNGVLQTAASGVAVTDYGYVDGRWVSKGLSLEPQATNLLVQSQDFTMWGRNGTNATLSRNTSLSPAGALSCATVDSTAAGVFGEGMFQGVGGVTAGGVYTASVFLKSVAGVGTFCFSMEGTTVFGGTASVYINQDTGTVASQAVIGAAVTIQVFNLGGWYRICMTRTAVASGALTVCCYSGVTGVNQFTVYGAQLETGPVATSYIPTTTAQVTRAADTSTSAQVTRAADRVYSTPAASVYSADAGTTCVEATHTGSKAPFPTVYEWSGDYSVYYHSQGSALAGSGRGSGGFLPVAPSSAGIKFRHAFSMTRGVAKASKDGGAVIGSAIITRPDTRVSALDLGGSGDRWGSYIRQLTYFPRQLSDADLQALTILED